MRRKKRRHKHTEKNDLSVGKYVWKDAKISIMRNVTI
jgi:hypothetical protein